MTYLYKTTYKDEQILVLVKLLNNFLLDLLVGNCFEIRKLSKLSLFPIHFSNIRTFILSINKFQTVKMHTNNVV